MGKFKNIRMLAAVLSITVVTVFMGNACSQMASIAPSTNASLGGAVCTTDKPVFDYYEGAPTVSLTYGPQTLENMIFCTALRATSVRTQDEYRARAGSFSDDGYAGDMNSAMAMGFAGLAIEVCNDLVNQEIGMDSTDRRIFNAVDLSSNSLSDAAIDETTARMARSCWGRDPDQEERDIINEEIVDMGNVSARLKAISICASVLASLDGISQ